MSMQILIGEVPYEIDEYGNVLKRRGKGFIKTFPDKDGYLKVAFTTKTGLTVNKMVHRLVYEAYVGPIPAEFTVDHEDSDKTNNHYSNLQLMYAVDNAIKGNARHWVLRSPTGERVEVYNLRQFCRDNGLHKSHLYGVFLGKPKYNSHKGWSKYDE